MKKYELKITEEIITKYQLNEKHIEAMNELNEVINQKGRAAFDFYWDELINKYGLSIFNYASFVHLVVNNKM